MTIEPIGDRLVIKPNSPEEKSKSGLLLTRQEVDKQDQGVVISVGKGESVKQFQEGDLIIYQKYGPASVSLDKENFVIVHIDEILGRIK